MTAPHPASYNREFTGHYPGPMSQPQRGTDKSSKKAHPACGSSTQGASLRHLYSLAQAASSRVLYFSVYGEEERRLLKPYQTPLLREQNPQAPEKNWSGKGGYSELPVLSCFLWDEWFSLLPLGSQPFAPATALKTLPTFQPGARSPV